MITDLSSTMDIFGMGMGVEKNYIENEIRILKSRTIREKAINQLFKSEDKENLFLFGTRDIDHLKFINLKKIFGIKKSDDLKQLVVTQSEIDDSILNIISLKFKDQINVSNERDTDMINISVTSPDPDEAALLVNTLIEVYKRADLEWATGELYHLKTFLTEQIGKKEIDLYESESSLENFQREERIFSVDDKSKMLLENLIKAESELYNTIAEFNILSERKTYIENKLTDDENKLVNRVSNTIQNRLIALQNEIAIKESELVTSIAQQGENHELVISIKKKLDGLKSNLESETRELISQGISISDPFGSRQSLMDSVITITARIAMLDTKQAEIKKLVNKYELELQDLPEKVLEYTSLSRNLNIQAETYSLMRQKLEEARINEASQVGKVRVIDPAKSDIDPIKPNKKLNLFIGLILGIFFSSLVVIIFELLDYTVTNLDDIDRRGLSILALIPMIDSPKKNNKKSKRYQKKLNASEKIQRRIITHEDPKSPVSEAYRSLRTSLMYSHSQSKDDSNVILISSPGPGEGKTTTIVNLAITFANLGKKTILIDGDLRKPVIHKIFSVEKESGITKYLSGIEKNYKKIINQSEIENLSFMTSGIVPPNPSEILASEKMKQLVSKLRSDYDIILIDSPPLLAVTDTFIAMDYASQFILVVRAGKTEKGGLDRAIDQINQTETPFKGVVMNAVDGSTTYGKGYYYSYYQYYNEIKE
tara:strand:- start:21677 stop:23812 length:2136 start_codon:yes stop_codon:yes gene_type:complete